MNEKENRIQIYSYQKVWNFEKKIYSFQNLNLPVPVNPYSILYVLGIALFFFVLGKIIPIITVVPAVLRFVMIPYIISNYLMKKKLDGKKPLKFFVGYVRYLFYDKRHFMERFSMHRDSKKISLDWYCGQGKEV